MAKKYLHISYTAPAVVGIYFDIDPDEWKAMDDGAKVAFVQRKMHNANNALYDVGCGAYIHDTSVNLSKLEVEEEENFSDHSEPEGGWSVEGRINE
jgi:hypothetical protein